MTASSAIEQKLWNYCNVLRDAGRFYGDYPEQPEEITEDLNESWSGPAQA